MTRINIDEVMKRKIPPIGRPSVICIGASAGGTVATAKVLSQLPKSSPGIVLVQHLPIGFSGTYAKTLNDQVELEVIEAENGLMVNPGRVILAKAGMHMALRYHAGQYFVSVFDGPRINYHKPSVDVLFRSVANAAGSNAIGVILTGMGDDGARGLQDLNAAGAITITQDENTSLVYGMPKVALMLTPQAKVLPVDKIASQVIFSRNRRFPSKTFSSKFQTHS